MLGLLVLVTALIQSRFLSISELQFVLVDTTIFALLAIGETMVVLTRNVDLSVGSVLGLSAFLSADMFGKHPGTSIATVFAVGIGIGVACGVANGLLTTIGRVPSLVVTLATLYIIRGIDVLIVGGGQVVASSLPNSFLNIPQATTLGIPDLAIVIAVGVAVVAYYLRSYRSGRELYAIGSNPDAARLAGIPIGRRVFMTFVVSGALPGSPACSGPPSTARSTRPPAPATSCRSIAAVVVGGVAIFGGSGTVVGAALGALLLNTINSALYVLGISNYWDQAIAGFLLIAAIALDRLITVQLTAALRRRSRLGA